jgi:Fe-S cluster assembly protein SufD
MNAAFASDGLYLELGDGARLDKPLHVIFAGTGNSFVALRNRIRLGRNAEAAVIEHYVGPAGGRYFTSTVTEIDAGVGSRLTRIRLQQESAQAFHIGNLVLHQARDSVVSLHGFDLGARLARSDTQVHLNGPGAEISLNGIYAPAGRQHIDNHTRIDHRQPQCRSREAFRGVIDGHGRGVFNGKIVVHKDAQKTDSQQSSAALLLSRHAEVDAKPELEIYADDVKCAHGATVGQLDEEAIFYLRSRGLDDTAARSLLTYSFADVLVRELPIPTLRRYVERELLSRLPGGSALEGLA